MDKELEKNIKKIIGNLDQFERDVLTDYIAKTLDRIDILVKNELLIAKQLDDLKFRVFELEGA